MLKVGPPRKASEYGVVRFEVTESPDCAVGKSAFRTRFDFQGFSRTFHNIFFYYIYDFYEIFRVPIIGRDTPFLFKTFFSIYNSFVGKNLALISKS